MIRRIIVQMSQAGGSRKDGEGLAAGDPLNGGGDCLQDFGEG